MSSPADALDAHLRIQLHGTIEAQEWIAERSSDQDLYSLFLAQSSAMGYSSSTTSSRAAWSRWSMNDAGQNWINRDSRGVLAWIRIDCHESVAAGFPTPVVEAMVCLDRAIRRAGVPTISGLDLDMPSPGAGANQEYLAYGQDWFSVSAPDQRQTVDITISPRSGGMRDEQRAAIRSAAAAWMTGQFAVIARDEPAASLHQTAGRTSLSVSVPEWSLDAGAWLTAVLNHAMHSSGVAERWQISMSPRSAVQSL